MERKELLEFELLKIGFDSFMKIMQANQLQVATWISS